MAAAAAAVDDEDVEGALAAARLYLDALTVRRSSRGTTSAPGTAPAPPTEAELVERAPAEIAESAPAEASGGFPPSEAAERSAERSPADAAPPGVAAACGGPAVVDQLREAHQERSRRRASLERQLGLPGDDEGAPAAASAREASARVAVASMPASSGSAAPCEGAPSAAPAPAWDSALEA